MKKRLGKTFKQIIAENKAKKDSALFKKTAKMEKDNGQKRTENSNENNS